MKKLDEIYNRVIKLPISSRSMSSCNAYIDQFMMNLSYETLPKKETEIHLDQLHEMIRIFWTMQGRLR